MTINQGIIDILMFALTTIVTWVIKVHVIPFLQSRHLQEIASIVVKAAESIYGASHGDEKLKYCIAQIENTYGIKINHEQVVNAIESAWLDLNNEQIELKLKENVDK